MQKSSIANKTKNNHFYWCPVSPGILVPLPAIIRSCLLLMLLILLPAFQPAAETGKPEANNSVVMVIHDREITENEIIRLWQKNNQLTDPQPLEEYVNQFINFHLKVAHAREEDIHLEESFREELEGYRKQLARSYMTAPGKESQLVKEAWERWQYDVNASHILVRLNPGYSPEDTLAAWEKAMQIRERIMEGESFERVARATSDDPSAKTNSGNLGYFTVFQTAYSFETAVYNAEPGKLGQPVRTPFGYHIILVNDIRESRGEILTSHIMAGFNIYEETEAKDKITELYEQLQTGFSFEMLASEYSTDINTAAQGGRLPWFGAGRLIPEFENAAFELENPGDISEPVRTAYGWHLIRLEERRSIPPLEEVSDELTERIRNSGDRRSRLLRDALVEKLKDVWDFSLNRRALEDFYHIVDDRVFDGDWSVPASYPLNEVLFSITGREVTQREFAAFISRNAYKRKTWPVDEYVHSLYEEFVSRWLIDHEEANLENRYPEFGLLIQEYKDGMLLFEITDREVWQRALNDSAGLAVFHRENKDDYMWGHRLEATIFSTYDNRVARRTARRANMSSWFRRWDDNWIIDRLNRDREEPVVTYEREILSEDEDKITGTVEWEAGAVGRTSDNDRHRIILVHEVLEPEPKALDEVRGKVISGYQDHLEQEWVQRLHEKYNVVVYENVMNDILNRY